jgi:hypothetical protein
MIVAQKLKMVDLNLFDMAGSLLVKWALKVFEGGQSNLHTLVRYRLENLRPECKNRWKGWDECLGIEE